MPAVLAGYRRPYGVQRQCEVEFARSDGKVRPVAMAADEVTAVYVPTAPRQLRLPRFPRALLALAALAAALASWAVLSLSVAGNESSDPVDARDVAPELVRAVAFLEHSQLESTLVLYGTQGALQARRVATFERINSGTIFGSVAPDALHAAVVHPAQHGAAQLSIVNLASGALRSSPGIVDANTALAWSPASKAVVAVTSTPPDATGRLAASLVQVDVLTAATETVTTFPSVFLVAPIGFAPGSDTILAVVVDQGGSTLWSVSGDERSLVASLSSGRTRDWVLSPDGSMLAFIELRSGGDVPAIGRVVFTANGASAAEFDEQAPFDGVAWKASSPVASFGGPGGNLAIEEGDSYLVPAAWSPAGDTLVARVVEPSPGGETSSQSWQIVPTSSTSAQVVRTVLFEHADSASFIGWARTSLLNSTPSTGAGTWP